MAEWGQKREYSFVSPRSDGNFNSGTKHIDEVEDGNFKSEIKQQPKIINFKKSVQVNPVNTHKDNQ